MISINGLRLGNSQYEGDNFIEREMQCGDLPVGVTKLWVNLKKPSILTFTMKVHCYSCDAKAQVVLLLNKTGVHCEEIKATPCCRHPVLEYVEISARLLNYNEVTLLPLGDVLFAPPARGALPRAGLLQVFPMKNKWVAVPGPQQDFYAHILANIHDRVERVGALCGPKHDQVQVQIVDEDVLSLQRLDSSRLTQCPGCGMGIEQDGGCDHMTCGKCGQSFNFVKAKVVM